MIARTIPGSNVKVDALQDHTADGKTHFVLVATNGRVVATSETYESKESCLKGVAAMTSIPIPSPGNATKSYVFFGACCDIARKVAPHGNAIW